MTLAQQLKEILLGDIDYYTDEECSISAIKDGFEIKYSLMYNMPPLTFDRLTKLSKLFGTTHIDVDDYSRSGCDTCDWGSEYGHTIQVYHPTKSMRKVKPLIGKGELW